MSEANALPPSWRFAAALLAACLCGCEAADAPSVAIDSAWHRRSAVDEHLAPILAAAPTPSGAFRARFLRSWEPEPKQTFGPTMQGRILYALATGHELTGNAAYLEEVRRGADFLLAHMIDPENGGVYEAVAADGKPVNTAKRLYSQAFAIFGLAHAYRVTRDDRYLRAADAIWERVRALLRDPSGGFVAGADRLFVKRDATLNQNPVMHLFEALLALYDATSDAQWLRHARDVSDFVVTRLLQKPSEEHRAIPEYYEAGWKPRAPGRGGYIDLGHQAEWAWLLSAAAERGLPQYYVDIGAKLLAFAIEKGYDRNRGGLYWRIDAQGKVTHSKVWWVQSELMRAVLRYAVVHGRTDLWPLYEQTRAYVQSEFRDAEHGGWTPQPKSECIKADACKHQADVGYHIVAMHVEAIKLAERQPRRP